MEKMNKQQRNFVSEVRDFDLLYETNPSLLSSRLKTSLCDDYEFFHLLESNFVDNATLNGLGEAFDLPSTYLLFVAQSFSSMLADTTVSEFTLLASPLPLVQCMGSEMGNLSQKNLPWLSHVLRRLVSRSNMAMK